MLHMRPLIKPVHDFRTLAAEMVTDIIRLLALKRESITGKGDVKNTKFSEIQDNGQISVPPAQKGEAGIHFKALAKGNLSM